MPGVYIDVIEVHTRYRLLVPIKKNGNLGLETLDFHFPDCTGLLYYNQESKTLMKISLIDEEFHPPGEVWPEGLYVPTYPKGKSKLN